MSLEAQLASDYIKGIANKSDTNLENIYALNDALKEIDARLKVVEEFMNKKNTTITGFTPERRIYEETDELDCSGR